MIYEKKCPVCETEFKTNISNKVYCCHSCANRGRYLEKMTKGTEDDFVWTKSHGKWDCPYQEGVGCYSRNCDKCGWNPEVAKARLDKIMGAHHER